MSSLETVGGKQVGGFGHLAMVMVAVVEPVCKNKKRMKTKKSDTKCK
jgi:hypothetical protein